MTAGLSAEHPREALPVHLGPVHEVVGDSHIHAEPAAGVGLAHVNHDEWFAEAELQHAHRPVVEAGAALLS